MQLLSKSTCFWELISNRSINLLDIKKYFWFYYNFLFVAGIIKEVCNTCMHVWLSGSLFKSLTLESHQEVSNSIRSSCRRRGVELAVVKTSVVTVSLILREPTAHDQLSTPHKMYSDESSQRNLCKLFNLVNILKIWNILILQNFAELMLSYLWKENMKSIFECCENAGIKLNQNRKYWENTAEI